MTGDKGVENSSGAEAQPPGASGPPSPSVFLSYASSDADTANTICQSLESHGVACWIAPRDVKPGAQYADAIVRAITEAKAVVLVMSGSAVASSHVGREVERAASKHKQIIAFRIDAAALSPGLEYFLSESQWIDVPKLGMPAALAKLKEAVGQGSKASSPAVAGKNAGGSKKRIVIAAAVVIGLSIAVGLGIYLWKSNHGGAQAPVAAMADKSIAVLPFTDMSEKKDQEYFADGLSEELIDHLAHTLDLKVIARTSSFQFKGKNDDMRTIGHRLGVANLLEGSVRTSGKVVRVTAQLIKVSDGSHLWSQTYDREMRDIFKVQDAIAEAVVTALQTTMAVSTPGHERSVNTDAYKEVLRGRYFSQKGTKEDSERAISAFREAIRLDPMSAMAFAELARTYYYRGYDDWMPIKEAYAEARAAVDRSLQIDPTLAIAHRVLGWIERDYKFDFVTARVEQKRADELDPSDPEVTRDAGLYAFITGHLDEAIRLFRKLVESDPLDTDAWSDLWVALIRSDRLTDAEAAARTVLELNPHYAQAHCALGWVLLYEHKPDAALAIMSEETDEVSRLDCQPDALWALGRREEADALLAELKAKYGDAEAFSLAGRYAIRNEKDAAFKWLDRAYEKRVPGVTIIRTDEAFRNLYDDPRWKAFLRKMNLPDD